MTNIKFLPTIAKQSRVKLTRISKMIKKGKILWSFNKFSQLTVWRLVWKICILILGFKGYRNYSKIGSFSINDGDGSKNVTIKMNLWHLFQFAENVKCRQISLKLISKRPHSSLERERKICHCLFTSSIKNEIRLFQVIVVQ